MTILKPEQLDAWTGRVVDVRDPDEFARERLARPCESIPLVTLTASAAAWDRTEPILLVCRSGVRSRQAAQQLEGMGFTQVATLEGGLGACGRSGVPMIITRAPLPMMRQVLIAAGIVLLTTLLLSLLHPALIAFTWLVAGMMLIAGITGVCPMARLLALMPWNRPAQQTGCSTESCSTC
jgi:rhodanese-related sulfurtransferase